MNKNQYDLLRQQDQNLREALRQEATELPPMPDDLNDRVLQRIGAQQKRLAKVHRLWPWIAAACVAAVMVVWLMPSKTSPPAPLAKERGVVTPNTQKVEEPVIAKVETTIAQPTAKPAKAKKARRQTAPAERDTVLIAQETIALTDAPEAETPLTAAEEAPLAAATPTVPGGFSAGKPKPTEPKPVTLTERDIPITRPENYKYTPEEIALLKKQADEAYLKWVELELEIAKHHLEQTAQQ